MVNYKLQSYFPIYDYISLLIFSPYSWLLFFFLIKKFFWLCSAACRILVPWAGFEPRPSAVRAWSANHWIPRKLPPITLTFFFFWFYWDVVDTQHYINLLYSIMIWFTSIMKWLPQVWWTSITSHRYKIKEKNVFLCWNSGFTLLTMLIYHIQQC